MVVLFDRHGEMSVDFLANNSSMSRNMANRLLVEWMDRGWLDRYKVTQRGNWFWSYRKSAAGYGLLQIRPLKDHPELGLKAAPIRRSSCNDAYLLPDATSKFAVQLFDRFPTQVAAMVAGASCKYGPVSVVICNGDRLENMLYRIYSAMNGVNWDAADLLKENHTGLFCIAIEKGEIYAKARLQ